MHSLVLLCWTRLALKKEQQRHASRRHHYESMTAIIVIASGQKKNTRTSKSPLHRLPARNVVYNRCSIFRASFLLHRKQPFRGVAPSKYCFWPFPFRRLAIHVPFSSGVSTIFARFLWLKKVELCALPAVFFLQTSNRLAISIIEKKKRCCARLTGWSAPTRGHNLTANIFVFLSNLRQVFEIWPCFVGL